MLLLTSEADISKNTQRPIYNDSFQQFATFSIGVIYKHLSELPSHEYMISCLYPQDGDTGKRFLACNNANADIQSKKAKDFKNEVQKLYDSKKTIDVCKLEGITTMQEYSSMTGTGREICSISGKNRKSFQFFLKAYTSLDWNEVVLRFLGNKTTSYQKSLAAFFYLSSKTDDYYLVPDGEIKQYNIHLGAIQKQQKLAKEAGLFLPIKK